MPGAGVPPGRKYQNEGGPAPREIAELMRNVMSPLIAEEAIWRFFDALAWNWLIAGTDAHAKNYSLLLAGTEVRLAPLRRRLGAALRSRSQSAALCDEDRRYYRVVPHHNTWPMAAHDLGLGPEQAIGRVRELAERAPDALRDAADEPDVVALGRPLPSRLVDLVRDRVSACVAILDRPIPPQSKSAQALGPT